MVQVIEQKGSIFGRLGKGLGQGLAEQLPKEVDRYRLSQGLKNLGQQEGLSPFQQFAELSGIPGITPQMIQSGSELLKQQGLRSDYARRANRGSEKQEKPQFGQQSIRDINFAKMSPNDRSALENQNMQMNPSQREQQTINEPGQPQITETNPLRPEAIPQPRWTPDRLNQEIDSLAQDFPNATMPELVNMAKEHEQRYLAQSEGERAKDTYTQEVRDKVDNEFNKQLELKLQKKGEGVFKDITGENIARVKRLIEKDIKTDQKANVNDIVNTRTNQLLDLAKTKNSVRGLAGKSIFEKIINGDQHRKGLESAAKTFRDTGNSREFKDMLIDEFNMSPQGASSIAYPLNKKLKDHNEKIKPSTIHNFRENSRKRAVEIEDLITANDSLLSIAYALRQKDPMFDQSSFFAQLNDDKENIRFTPSQLDELINGTSEVIPNWGDISLLPIFRGIK